MTSLAFGSLRALASRALADTPDGNPLLTSLAFQLLTSLAFGSLRGGRLVESASWPMIQA